MTALAPLYWAIAGGGIVLGALALIALRRPPLALHVVLDFLLAAGLLRLSADATWQSLAVIAVVVLVRRVVTLGLMHPAAQWYS